MNRSLCFVRSETDQTVQDRVIEVDCTHRDLCKLDTKGTAYADILGSVVDMLDRKTQADPLAQTLLSKCSCSLAVWMH